MANMDTFPSPRVIENHPDAKITFILPTIGRDTLPRALESLYAMHLPEQWIAYVVFDGVEPTHISTDSRVYTMQLSDRHGSVGCAGNVRNGAMDHVYTPWTAFVDDDDTVDPRYLLEWTQELRRTPAVDVVVFRMRTLEGRVIPSADCVRLTEGEVGISFAVRTAIRARFPTQGLVEDYQFLRELKERGMRMVVSPAVVYYVRGSNRNAENEPVVEGNYRRVML